MNDFRVATTWIVTTWNVKGTVNIF